jgi:hypothetical protein
MQQLQNTVYCEIVGIEKVFHVPAYIVVVVKRLDNFNFVAATLDVHILVDHFYLCISSLFKL